MTHRHRALLFVRFLSALTCVACAACSSRKSTAAAPTLSPTGVARNVVLTWTANREKAVNTTGGGYKVYYSQSAGFAIPSPNVIDVPYASGSTPTTATVRLSPGVYYFRVAAYSAMKPLSGGSSQLTVTIP